MPMNPSHKYAEIICLDGMERCSQHNTLQSDSQNSMLPSIQTLHACKSLVPKYFIPANPPGKRQDMKREGGILGPLSIAIASDQPTILALGEGEKNLGMNWRANRSVDF